MFLLLVFVSIYAYNNIKTYPGLGPDSRFYDVMANTLSRNIMDGEFNFKSRDDTSQYYRDYSVHQIRIQQIPYGFVVPLSFIYLIFGYNPFLAKVFNIIAFYFAIIEFYKLLLLWKPDSKKQLLRVLKFFAFWPPLIISSVSLVKEPFLMLCYVAFIRALLEKKYIKMFIWMGIGLMIRPYTFPIILLIYLIVKFKDIKIKQKVAFLLVAVISFLYFFSINFQYFNVNKYLSETTYDLKAGSYDFEVKEVGVLNLVKTVVTNPVFFVKYQIYSLFYAFLLPKPWVTPFIISSKYANVGTINFSGIFYWMHSFIWYYFDFIFILLMLNIKKIGFNKIKFELITFFALFTIIPLLRHHELRYIIMSIWPWFLIMYYRVGHKLKLYRNTKTLAFLIWFLIVGYAFYLDFF